ncbi:MAG: helix-turn-helix domain-containing protein [Lachnospiraceae bacterium]|nr:helix-turn-helix domain-containing protein [Lachnospiraceae bacterium]
MKKENISRLTYNVEETAIALGVSKSLLYREIQQGTLELPYHKIGNRILFSVSSLEEYLSK